jgi:hypothetical protein
MIEKRLGKNMYHVSSMYDFLFWCGIKIKIKKGLKTDFCSKSVRLIHFLVTNGPQLPQVECASEFRRIFVGGNAKLKASN